MVNLSGARFLKNLLVVSTDNAGLNVIEIISLNIATALSGRTLEKEFFISGIYFLIMKNRRLLNYGLIELDYMEVMLDVQFLHRMIIKGQMCGYNNEYVVYTLTETN